MIKSFGCRSRPVVFIFFLCGVSLGLFPVLLRAGQNVVLAWSPSISTNIVGYRIYYGTTSGNYTGRFDVGDTNIVTISRVADGVTYYFAATSVDGTGNESPFSNEAVYTVPTAAATLTASPVTAAMFSFSASGVAGYQYVVQTSTNLMDWVSVQTNTAPFTFTETKAADLPQCFYRAIYLAPASSRSPSPKLTPPN